MAISAENLRTRVGELLAQARDAQTSDQIRKANLAEAAAYLYELRYAVNGSVPLNVERVNSNIRAFEKAFSREEQKGMLDSLAALQPDAFGTRVKNTFEAIDGSAAAEEFGLRTKHDIANAHDPDAESVAYARARSANIFRQMDRTWRVSGSSAEFGKAKKAMQDISDLERPEKVDQYLAGETVKAYVTKNLNKARSAVGRTRMACSLAFLKQTMPEAVFRAYCNTLNLQRGIPRMIGQEQEGLAFENTDPRCIVPEEIGTVKQNPNQSPIEKMWFGLSCSWWR